jgi:RimJ/RimL family protein N-acetyltransferase
MSATIRPLAPGDETAREAFLAARAETSIFLRSNLRTGGLTNEGGPLQGTWVAAFEGDRPVGVVQHGNRGYMPVQAPDHAGPLALEAARRSGRRVKGAVGPWEQVLAVRDALGLPVAKLSHEHLFALALEDLAVPADLALGRVRCRRPHDREIETLVAWRILYAVETITGESDPAEIAREAREGILRLHGAGDLFVLEDPTGTPVAMTSFNAKLPDTVQIGGVYAPPALRGRGHARAAVAGSLLDARARGVSRAILFTGESNVPARRAYVSLGFRRIGDYGILAFTS